MFYILYGADDFSAREALKGIKAGLGDVDSLASNTTVFEGQRLGFGQLMDACIAMPFLGSYRLVIVEGLLSRFEKRDRTRLRQNENGVAVAKKSGEVKEWGALADRVAEMPPSTVLVLVDGEVSKDNALLKALAPVAEVREFRLLKGERLGQWIQQRVAQQGARVSPQASRLLASLVGQNLWVLASEIEKLALYASGRDIDVADVQALVSHAREANVFAMVDALLQRRAPVAAGLLHQLLQEGATAPYLVSMVTRQVRILVQVKELRAKGESPSQIRASLGLASDYTLSKALEQADRYSTSRLEHFYDRLLETDLSIKRGLWKAELALDFLVAELCA